MARSLLQHLGISLSFRAEAVFTSAYLRNRIPTVQLKDFTPYERWYNKNADVSILKVFDCKALVHIPDAKQKGKLDEKTIACIFVGYPTTENSLKLYNPQTKQIFQSHDVLFAGNKFETYINDYNKENCESFIENMHLNLCDNAEDTELTQEKYQEIFRNITKYQEISLSRNILNTSDIKYKNLCHWIYIVIVNVLVYFVHRKTTK